MVADADEDDEVDAGALEKEGRKCNNRGVSRRGPFANPQNSLYIKQCVCVGRLTQKLSGCLRDVHKIGRAHV